MSERSELQHHGTWLAAERRAAQLVHRPSPSGQSLTRAAVHQ